MKRSLYVEYTIFGDVFSIYKTELGHLEVELNGKLLGCYPTSSNAKNCILQYLEKKEQK